MRKTLIAVESASATTLFEMARSVAAGAEEVGADIRLLQLRDAGLDDIRWADTLVTAIEGRMALPHEAKRWLDALGHAGWRALQGKPGCVLASGAADKAEADAACRLVEGFLEARGMDISAPVDFEGNLPDAPDWAALGRALATSFEGAAPAGLDGYGSAAAV